MGLFDLFGKKKNESSFEVFPDVRDYKLYYFLKMDSINVIKSRMSEYHVMYGGDMPFSMELYEWKDTSWYCLGISIESDKTNELPMWHYFNLLLWLSTKTQSMFAVAVPVHSGMTPLYAETNISDSLGSTCMGISNGNNFICDIPDKKVQWLQGVNRGFDYYQYINDRFGVDIRDLRSN
ncbi:MAG: hypothetical protein K6E10_01670 [Eubacterium sp.]|nr:hypothetical protein [Eubacterium sp.]